jgi:hypothetical protein
MLQIRKIKLLNQAICGSPNLYSNLFFIYTTLNIEQTLLVAPTQKFS